MWLQAFPATRHHPCGTRGLRPASRVPGRVCSSQEESPFTGGGGDHRCCPPPPRPPLRHLYARLQVCCAVYRKHTFSLLAKPHRQFRVYFALLTIPSLLLRWVSDTAHFFSSLLVLASRVFSSFICLSLFPWLILPEACTWVLDGWLAFLLGG